MFAELKLPKGKLIISYDRAADDYYQFESSTKDVLSKLAFLGAIARIEFDDSDESFAVTAENLQKVGIGRRSLSVLVDSVLLCDADRFEILDGASNVLESESFRFDGSLVTFESADGDIYQNTIWEKLVTDEGRIGACVADIKRYCKINGKSVRSQTLEATVTDGGCGWFLGAILLKVSVSQGKLELSIPTLLF